MKFYSDLYCMNDSMHGCTMVTLVDRYERLIFRGTMDELNSDFVGNVSDTAKSVIAQWATWHATVCEYHIVSVSTTAPIDACAVPLTTGLYISELYVKVSGIGKLREMLHARGLEWSDLDND